MGLILSCLRSFALTLMLLIAIRNLSDCYDPLDPTGNITVTFDVHEWRPDGYVARVTIQNYYQYRHVDKPGWQLGWTWAKDEVIWSMSGAFATRQGNCSAFKFQTPHSCKKDPVIIDLMPEALPVNRSEDCCRGGLLSAWAIDPSKSFSSFEITVGNLESNSTGYCPLNLTLMAPGPGYTCGPVLDTDPTVSSAIGGRRQVQVFRTWKSICTYSTYLANKTPICCVSLSAFYNPYVTSCPTCSCGCRGADQNSVKCIREGNSPAQSDYGILDMVQCTDHLCPIRVHWHIKTNYVDYWKVKLTITNYNFMRNYSDWNVLVQHPGFSQKATTNGFNNTLLPAVGFEDTIALFWGKEFYNTLLLQTDEEHLGSLTADILLKKDFNLFTLSNGWAFPRRIYFNGDNCQMPLPDSFPMLPNGGSTSMKPTDCLFLLLIYMTFKTLL